MEERVQADDSKPNKKVSVAFVFVRECFKFDTTVGYLLSNGVVGSFNK